MENTVVRNQLDPEVRSMRGDTGGPGLLFYVQQTEELQAEMPDPFRFNGIPCGFTIANFILEAKCDYTASVQNFFLSLRTNIEPDRENLIVGESYVERQQMYLGGTGTGQTTHVSMFPVLVKRSEPVSIQIAPLNEGYPSVNITKMTLTLKVMTAELHDFDTTGIDPRIVDTIRPRLAYPLQLLEDDS